jgi:hypothetical protein
VAGDSYTPSDLCILANRRHIVDRNEGELLAFIKCFPNLKNLSISWSLLQYDRLPGYSLRPTDGACNDLSNLRRLEILIHSDFDIEDDRDRVRQSIWELRSLFNHLPLCHVRDVGVFFEDLANSDTDPADHPDSETYYQQLVRAIKSMRFRDLESFHLGFIYEVFELPSGSYGEPSVAFLISHRAWYWSEGFNSTRRCPDQRNFAGAIIIPSAIVVRIYSKDTSCGEMVVPYSGVRTLSRRRP